MIIRINDAAHLKGDVEAYGRFASSRRKQLAEQAPISSISELNQLFQDVTYDDGVLNVLGAVARFQQNGATPDEQRDYLVSILCYGADDTWSGRGNDAKRSHYDGKREAAKTLLERI